MSASLGVDLARAQGVGPWTHTTVADFDGCSQLAGTSIANINGGEVRLSAVVEDYFDGPVVDGTIWYSETYSGQTTWPYQSNGILTTDSSAVVTNYTDDSPYLDVEGRLQFAPDGLDGVADFGLGYPNLITFQVNALFITDGSGNLFANNLRDGLGLPRQRTPITGVDLTQFHDFRIELMPTQVNYYVDGVLRVTHAQTTLLTFTPMGLWILTQGIGRPFNAEWARWNQYPASGTFVSCAIDAGQSVNWSTLTRSGQTPSQTGVSVETRSSDNQADWTAWSAANSAMNFAIDSPAGRYLQYRLTLTTSNDLRSPQVDDVSVTASIGPATDTPTPSSTPTPSNTPTDSPTPTATDTATPTPTPTASNTPTSAATATATATDTPTPTATNTSTATPTSTGTSTNTPTPSNTPTDTATHTPTSTSTATFTPTNTATGTPSPSPTATHTPTVTATPMHDWEIYLPIVTRSSEFSARHIASRLVGLLLSILTPIR
jgi:hypothetical protein